MKGSYAGAGYLISNISLNGTVSNYARWLDLDQGIARTSWTQSGTTYLRHVISLFICSYQLNSLIPAQHFVPIQPSLALNISPQHTVLQVSLPFPTLSLRALKRAFRHPI
jgi:Glycosyl hydrolase family 65, N-terminal domain